MAPGDNLKGGVFTPWRVALYVAGDVSTVKNALLLLDAFWMREARPANGQPTEVQIHPHVGIDVAEVKEERARMASVLAAMCPRAFRSRTLSLRNSTFRTINSKKRVLPPLCQFSLQRLRKVAA